MGCFKSKPECQYQKKTRGSCKILRTTLFLWFSSRCALVMQNFILFWPSCCQRLVFCFEVFWVVDESSRRLCSFLTAWTLQRTCRFCCQQSFLASANLFAGVGCIIAAQIATQWYLDLCMVIDWCMSSLLKSMANSQSQWREFLHVSFQSLHHKFLYIPTRKGCSAPTPDRCAAKVHASLECFSAWAKIPALGTVLPWWVDAAAWAGRCGYVRINGVSSGIREAMR